MLCAGWNGLVDDAAFPFRFPGRGLPSAVLPERPREPPPRLLHDRRLAHVRMLYATLCCCYHKKMPVGFVENSRQPAILRKMQLNL